MQINGHTKIAVLLKGHPQALDTIVSINPTFEKLRSPFLRKLMAGRTSIRMAAQIAGCREEDFFRALRPLGFEQEKGISSDNVAADARPVFLQSLKKEQIVTLDVRPVLEKGNDPLKEILSAIKKLKPGDVLRIINTFEPTPLIVMLKEKGFQSWSDLISSQLVETWFYRQLAETTDLTPEEEMRNEGWEQIMAHFSEKLLKVDVRELQMPQPMHRILEELDTLPPGYALYVFHKRIPLFLLPELAQRSFDYRSKQIADTEVHLLIFKALTW